MDIEYRYCPECGERWVDGGETACIYCQHSETYIDDSED